MNTRFEELKISQLAIHPKNVRKDVGIVTDLANSMTAQGVMQPLVVAPTLQQAPPGWNTPNIATHGQYTIIAGHRRHAAAQLANLTVLPCVIREDLDTEPKQLEAMLVENTQRTDLTIMEEARGYQALLDFPGYTVKSIAKNVGRSQKLVKDRAKLTTLPQGAIAKLEQHQMTLEDAMVFAEFADIPAASAELLANHGSYNWDWAVRRWREELKRREIEAQTIAALQVAGAEVLDEPEDVYDRDSAFVSAARFSDFEGWTTEQHVEAGHLVFPSPRDGKAVWILPKDQAPEVPADAPRPETPEEAEERLRRENLDAGLKIAGHVRREHLKAQMLKPTAKVLESIRQANIDAIVAHLGGPLAVEFFDLAEDAGKAEIRVAVQDLTGDQLTVLRLLAGRNYEEREMENADGWGQGEWGGDYCATYRAQIQDLFDYTLSDIEREAITYQAERKQAREDRRKASAAAAKAEQDQEDDEDA